MKKTMLELERDMAQNEVNRWFGLTTDAVASGKAEYAAQFAGALLRAARRLHARQAAVNAEHRRAMFAEWRKRETQPALQLSRADMERVVEHDSLWDMAFLLGARRAA